MDNIFTPYNIGSPHVQHVHLVLLDIEWIYTWNKCLNNTANVDDMPGLRQVWASPKHSDTSLHWSRHHRYSQGQPPSSALLFILHYHQYCHLIKLFKSTMNWKWKVSDTDFTITLHAYFMVKWKDARLIVEEKRWRWERFVFCWCDHWQ